MVFSTAGYPLLGKRMGTVQESWSGESPKLRGKGASGTAPMRKAGSVETLSLATLDEGQGGLPLTRAQSYEPHPGESETVADDAAKPRKRAVCAR